ncbi:MAG: hypothetical protein J0H40_05675 [Rhizobiales bacterium]|nr:hypothetical protein [Hyphomicrobiales bacterium]
MALTLIEWQPGTAAFVLEKFFDSVPDQPRQSDVALLRDGDQLCVSILSKRRRDALRVLAVLPHHGLPLRSAVFRGAAITLSEVAGARNRNDGKNS